MRKPLTPSDWQTIRSALNYAMDERAGFAEAYSNTGPEAARALGYVKRFEELHHKIFGCPSARQDEAERFALMPRRTLEEIARTALTKDGE